MNYSQIKSLQKLYGADRMQNLIDSGEIWKFEGTVGRYAMDLLRGGACMLPLQTTWDYWGNRIPTRKEVKPGTTGSFQNCRDYWQAVNDGDIDAVEALEYI
jgi:hypothetical protein